MTPLAGKNNLKEDEVKNENQIVWTCSLPWKYNTLSRRSNRYYFLSALICQALAVSPFNLHKEDSIN